MFDSEPTSLLHSRKVSDWSFNWSRLQSMQDARAVVGSQVEVFAQEDGKWYTGEVTDVSAQGLQVQYKVDSRTFRQKLVPVDSQGIRPVQRTDYVGHDGSMYKTRDTVQMSAAPALNRAQTDAARASLRHLRSDGAARRELEAIRAESQQQYSTREVVAPDLGRRSYTDGAKLDPRRQSREMARSRRESESTPKRLFLGAPPAPQQPTASGRYGSGALDDLLENICRVAATQDKRLGDVRIQLSEVKRIKDGFVSAFNADMRDLRRELRLMSVGAT